MTSEGGKPDEFNLIASVFNPLTDGDERALGLMDDAAVMPQREDFDTIITTDTMVAGVHFLDTERPDLIARRLLRVNLSDLASMGAVPTGYFLNLTLNDLADKLWLDRFAAGLRKDQDEFNFCLLGGDTTHTKRDLTLTATFVGEVDTGFAITRTGASAGDDVYVSGTIGDAALGLKYLISGDNKPETIIRRFQLPDPRVALGTRLRGLVSAAADVSDGLVADLVHICRASKVSATIIGDQVPVSPIVDNRLAAGDIELSDILSGGDDYELVFTAPTNLEQNIVEAAQLSAVRVTKIGKVLDGPEMVRVLNPSGDEIKLEALGYSHF
ncbi:MAG: thiamine-phosphate kinase [Pseudomonadota bacterium]|nr:thiamine-phosphate kinase [Pseudomonadota bacterium]